MLRRLKAYLLSPGEQNDGQNERYSWIKYFLQGNGRPGHIEVDQTIYLNKRLRDRFDGWRLFLSLPEILDHQTLNIARKHFNEPDLRSTVGLSAVRQSVAKKNANGHFFSEASYESKRSRNYN